MRQRRLLMPQARGEVVLQETFGLDSNRRFGGQAEQFYYYFVEPPEHKGLLYWIRRTIILTFQGSVLLLLSALSYAALYRYHQPKLMLHREVHFDYFQHESRPRLGIKKILSQLLISKNHRSESPSAFVNFNESGVDLIESIQSNATRVPSFFSPQQQYYAEIILQLPESDANIQAGMWELQLELIGGNSARRSLHFPYRSAWVRTSRNIATLVPLLLSVIDESQWMQIPMLRHQRGLNDTRAARVTCGAPEITTAYLLIGEEWGSVYTVLRTWFWTGAITGTMLFCTIYILFWSCFDSCCGERQKMRQEGEYNPYDSPSLNGSFHVEEVFHDDTGEGSVARDEFVDAQMHDHGVRTSPLNDYHVHIPEQPVEFADDSSEYWEEITIGGAESIANG